MEPDYVCSDCGEFWGEDPSIPYCDICGSPNKTTLQDYQNEDPKELNFDRVNYLDIDADS